jgi:hypothetical protein
MGDGSLHRRSSRSALSGRSRSSRRRGSDGGPPWTMKSPFPEKAAWGSLWNSSMERSYSSLPLWPNLDASECG